MSSGNLGRILVASTLLVAGCRGRVAARLEPAALAAPAPAPGPRTTDWRLEPSFKYDALCLLNVLSGDSFYLRYYGDEYARLARRLTPAAREALRSLKRKVKDESGNIISAFLTLYFSASDAETLDELIATVGNSAAMRERLRATPYYSESGWELYQSIRPELRTIFTSFRDSGFEADWLANARPRAMARIAQLGPELPRFDVVREVEVFLGAPLASNRITVYVLVYSQPHGIRITGTRFLTDAAWPFRIVLRNAVHEMLHPPYDVARDGELREALDRLRGDSLLMDRVTHHNQSFGYNSFEGFVEEDVVQAMEQVINERLGVAVDACERWRASDDGMHVLAVALYQALTTQTPPAAPEPIRTTLLRLLRDGTLAPGRIRGLVDTFYAN